MGSMKLRTWAAVLISTFCMVFLSASGVCQADSSEWAWMSGSDWARHQGIYGIKGTADAANVSGARSGSVSWTDADFLWLFGGSGYDSTGQWGRLNDLWRYDSDTNMWTWVSGSDIEEQDGVYGTKGIQAAANVPGARTGSVSWTDNTGELWLFGGVEQQSQTSHKYLNDLWRYDPVTNMWTWVSGADTGNEPGTYGIKVEPHENNVPGARHSSISWTDSQGALWLFGGGGHIVSSYATWLNDLWRYDPATNMWTWMSGSSAGAQDGVYGTRGIPDAANVPGARYDSISWMDSAGDLWLFGGTGYDRTGQSGKLNDLWRYDPDTNMWTWMGGSDIEEQTGFYGIKGIPDAANVPGARSQSISWTDSAGDLWLLGGWVYSDNTSLLYLNDLWRYDPATNMWTWMGGSDIEEQAGVYGIKGESDDANIPGSRSGSISWADSQGALWLFGGYGVAATAGTRANLNDLWRFELPDCKIDEDCDAGQVCARSGMCTPACVSNSDCAVEQFCNPDTGQCVECLSEADCDDDVFCNGDEFCVQGVCALAPSPCQAGELCDEAGDRCIECLSIDDCGDGVFCNGEETCDDGLCVAAISSPCGEPTLGCDEFTNLCLCASDSDCFENYTCVPHPWEPKAFCLENSEPDPDPDQWEYQHISSSCEILALWANSENDMYVGGNDLGGMLSGCLYHNDGNGWQEVELPGSGPVFDIWGSAVDNVYVTGLLGSYHYDGASTWTPVPYNTSITAVWGFPEGDVFFGGNAIRRYQGIDSDGELMTVPSSVPQVNGLWGLSETDMYAVGPESTVLHYDGNPAGEWDFLTTGLEGSNYALYDVWGSAPDDIYASGPNILHYDGTAWTYLNIVLPQADWFGILFGFASDDVYAVTFEYGYVLHYDGISWTILNPAAADPVADSFQQAALFDSPSGTMIDFPESFSVEAIGGASPQSIYFAGSDGTILHYTPDVSSCESDSDCEDFYECVEGACEAIPDNVPAITSGPFLAKGVWPELPITSANPVYLEQNEYVLWTFSDDYAAGCENCTHLAEYQAVGAAGWTALAVTSDKAQGYASVELPIVSLTNATTYAFRFSVTDCASQSAQSQTYYFRVAKEDNPPVIALGPFLAAGTWPALSRVESRAFVIAQDEDVLWSFDDDYATCSDMVWHRARYHRIVDDGTWIWEWLDVGTDSTEKEYAYARIPASSMEAGTYRFVAEIIDCAGQLTRSTTSYFKVE